MIGSAIPVNIITGALGAGKTTAIARLLADKPATESWLVILNEFTDAGIDTLTLAVAARGAYDLRTIPGGCLCCTGEADFRQQLSALLAQPESYWPRRILIEPSGIGHPGAIVEELRLFERNGALSLQSTVVLVSAQQGSWGALPDTAQAQVNAADVVLLSKADLASDAQRVDFQQWAQQLFPPKRWIGYSEQGRLPSEALQPPLAAFSFELPKRPSLHQAQRHASGHAHSFEQIARGLIWQGASVQARAVQLLQRAACGWLVPTTLLFDMQALHRLLESAELWHVVERFKAVLRTGVDDWCLVQRWDAQTSVTPCDWRQDSRIEMQLKPGVVADWVSWDARWQQLAQRCPVV